MTQISAYDPESCGLTTIPLADLAADIRGVCSRYELLGSADAADGKPELRDA